jgi:hypothetical protein
MSQESDRIKALFDEDLELEVQQINPKIWKNSPVHRELYITS